MARSVRAARNALVGALALGAPSFIAAPLAAQQDAKPAQNPGQAQPTQAQPGQPEGRQPGQRAGGPQNVEGAMKGMNRAIRNLNRALDGTGTAEDALKTVAEAQAACAQCRMFQPEHANGDAAKITEFRKRLIGVSRALLDIEEQLMACKNAEAKAALEKIKSMQEEGHNALGVKDE